MKACVLTLVALLFFGAARLGADQVEMQNGDRYAGKVVSMTADTVVLQSDILGKVTLPRAKVAGINLAAKGGAVTPSTNQLRRRSLVLTNSHTDVARALQQLGADTNLTEQVRKQFLGEAGPVANAKFNELMGDLVTNNFDLTHLRAEAKTAADQIRALKRDGGDVGEPLDSYLAILDKFLNQTNQTVVTPSSPQNTNNPAQTAP